MDEIIGRQDLLERVERPDVPRAQMLDLSVLLAPTDEEGHPRVPAGPLRRTVERNDRPGLVSLDAEILDELRPYLESGLPFSGNYPIYNHHLAVGARVAGAIVERTGDAGLAPGSVRLRFTGSAGQSFGAFTCRGMHLELEGEANDYVGKGLSGGEITIRPFRRAAYADVSHQHLVIGNTVLYGATGGKLFAAGQAGDRFAVRNSGAIAVIEGAGNHCCEYMTSGIVVVLGRAGPELRRRHVERRGVRARRGRHLREPDQPGHGRADRPGRARRRAAPAAGAGARGAHRESAGPHHPGAVGELPAAVPEGGAEGGRGVRRGDAGGVSGERADGGRAGAGAAERVATRMSPCASELALRMAFPVDP